MKTIQTLEKDDEYLSNTNNYNANELNIIIKENEKLNFLFDLYNKILDTYQLKYGDELYQEIKEKFSKEELSDEYYKSKYHLLSNISIIKEYESEIEAKEKHIESLELELNEKKNDIEILIESEKDALAQLENALEDKAKLVKEILNGNKDANSLINNQYNSKSINNTKNNFNKTIKENDLNSNYNWNTTNNFNNKINTYSSNKENNHIYSLIDKQRDELLTIIENFKLDNEKLKLLNQTLNSKLSDLEKEYESVYNEYNSYKLNNEDFLQMREDLSKKYIKMNEEIILLEKELESKTNILEKQKSEDSLIKKELAFYKENYEDLEKRKNIEIESLIKDINNYKITIKNNTEQIYDLEEENSLLKFDTSRIKQELLNTKEDILQYTKALEESNKVVSLVKDKEKLLNTSINNYKRKSEEMNTEKEKGSIKIRLLEQQISKLNLEYNKNSNERQAKYENLLATIQNRYSVQLEEKEEVNTSLKSELQDLQIERDKLYNDLTFIKKEYDKLLNTFKEENAKYILKYEHSEKKAILTNEELRDKIIDLQKKIDKLENDKNILDKEVKIYVDNDKNKDYIINKLSSVEETREKEISKIKERLENALCEKEEYEKELIRQKNMYELKLNQIKDESSLKYEVINKTLKNQKSKFCETESKAFEMLKKQEAVSY